MDVHEPATIIDDGLAVDMGGRRLVALLVKPERPIGFVWIHLVIALELYPRRRHRWLHRYAATATVAA